MLAGPLDTAFYRFLHAWVPPLFRFLFRMEIRGAEHVPTSGAVVLASNHRSNTDPFFVGLASARQVHFMAKAELWKVPLLGRLVELLGSFPVRRGEADREAVRNALAVLSKGGVLGIFPEGHRQRHGRLGEPQPGFALFSLRPGVVTIPVALDGTERIVRSGLPRLPRITVTFGPPLSREVGGSSKAEAHRALAASWQDSLGDLLGQRPLETTGRPVS
jgi:1-acyl-sn-glycerol-3-phosphate acyltransferase